MTATLERSPVRPVDAPRVSRWRMWRGQWRVALRLARRDAWHAKGRSLLVLLIVGLPVAAVTVAIVGSAAANAADKPLGQLLGSLPPQADARVWLASPGVYQSTAGDQSDGGSGVEATFDEVAAAFPAGSRFVPFGSSTTTLILTAGAWAIPSGFAVEDVTDPLLADRWDVTAGRLPSAAGEVALSRTEAAKLRVGVGDRIQVSGTGARKDEEVGLDVVGIVSGGSNGYESVVLPSTSVPSLVVPFQAWFVVSPAPITWADVRAVNAVGGVVGSRAVAEDPPGFCGQYQFCLDDGPAPQVAGDSSTGTIDEEVARNAALVAVVSVLVVLQIALLAGPAFAVQLRRRQWELGLVGASGGDSRQLARTVLASGVVLGVVASALGVLVGWGSVWLLGHPGPTHAIGGPGYDVGPPPVPRVVALVAVIGVLAAVSAAIVPALAAGRGDVVDALKGRRPLPAIRSRRPLLGLLVGVVGLGVMAYGVSRLDSLVLVVGIVCAQLGVVLVMPWLVVQTARIGRHLPLGPRVAVRDSARHRMRTTAAACAIAAAAAAAVGATAWAGSLDYGSRNDDVAVVDGVTAISDYGMAYADDGTSQPEDHVQQAQEAVLRADPGARVTVMRPLTAPTGYDSDTGAGTVVCGPDPSVLSYSDEPAPCQGRSTYGFQPASVLVVDPAALDLVLGPVAPLDEARAALDRGDVVVLQPDAVTDGRVVLWITGALDSQGRPTTVGSLDVPAIEVVSGAVPAQALVGPAFLERQDVRGRVATGPGGAVLGAPATPDVADRPSFEDRVLLELVRDDAQLSLYSAPRFTDDVLVFALVTAAATLVMALLAGLMVTALALADGRADVATLAAVGAPPRVRRRMAASSAGYVSMLGCVVGAASGLVAGRLLLPLAQPGSTWRTPWLVVLLVVVAVPLLTSSVAWVTTRSRVVLTRRLDS